MTVGKVVGGTDRGLIQGHLPGGSEEIHHKRVVIVDLEAEI
jgi:hypothetical protein